MKVLGKQVEEGQDPELVRQNILDRDLKWDYDSPNNLVCYNCHAYTVVCLDRCTKHYCTTCTAHQRVHVAPRGSEDVMNPRSRWQYGMGIGNRCGEEAERFMNDDELWLCLGGGRTTRYPEEWNHWYNKNEENGDG